MNPPTLSTPTEGEKKSERNILGSQHGGSKMIIVYTCKVCETRSAKQFTKKAFEEGVVIIQCPGCKSYHLIADNLQYFDQHAFNIEELLTERGDSIAKAYIDEEYINNFPGNSEHDDNLAKFLDLEYAKISSKEKE